MALDELLRAQLTQTLQSTDFDGLGTKVEGKVRDNYVPGDGRRIIVVTDRLSAFDVVLGTIPFKGQVLNQMAQYWFEVTREVAPNHVISVPDPNVTVAKECEPLPVEFVMRAYLTGTTDTSIWRAYESGAREFCGHELPDGMVRHQALPKPLLTPSTKAEKGGHDVSVSREQLLASGKVNEADFERAAEIAANLFELGRKHALERGMILVDTKYEMGKAPDGSIMVIDEIHTPDSSRYWYAADYDERMAKGLEPRSLDKEFVRRWLVTKRAYTGNGAPPALPDDVRVEAAKRYIETFELITGREFEPDTFDPSVRIPKNLGVNS